MVNFGTRLRRGCCPFTRGRLVWTWFSRLEAGLEVAVPEGPGTCVLGVGADAMGVVTLAGNVTAGVTISAVFSLSVDSTCIALFSFVFVHFPSTRTSSVSISMLSTSVCTCDASASARTSNACVFTSGPGLGLVLPDAMQRAFQAWHSAVFSASFCSNISILWLISTTRSKRLLGRKRSTVRAHVAWGWRWKKRVCGRQGWYKLTLDQLLQELLCLRFHHSWSKYHSVSCRHPQGARFLIFYVAVDTAQRLVETDPVTFEPCGARSVVRSYLFGARNPLVASAHAQCNPRKTTVQTKTQ